MSTTFDCYGSARHEKIQFTDRGLSYRSAARLRPDDIAPAIEPLMRAGMQNGRVELKGVKPAGSIDGFVGFLAKKSRRALTIEQMNTIVAEGWAGLREDHR